MNFTELNLSKEVLRGLEEIGFSEPTDVQAQTIPLIQEGTDVIGHSKTGTGKTAAFLLASFTRLLNNPPPAERQHATPRMVVMAVIMIGRRR